MGYVEMTMTIATFCQECDEDLEVAGTLLLPANTMSYTCTKCGSSQEQSNWIEEKA
jgi:NMD protein affecting ribosome stability and mRNA decay